MKKLFLISIAALLAIAIHFFVVSAKNPREDFGASRKNINLSLDGNTFEIETEAQTVRDVLAEQNISAQDKVVTLPDLDSRIYQGSQVAVFRIKKVTVKEGGETFELETTQKVVENVIWENENIDFLEDDIAEPSREALVRDGMDIAIIHVEIKEEIKHEDIPFKTITNEDSSMGWREKKTTQKGQKGITEVKYRVVYHDGKEISRKILEKNVAKEPVEEIITQGTYVKTAKKAHTGWGTWYAYKGGLFAASPWLPMGSYARVTNKANGKSVIVQINDRGLFGENRIIDLDKVAFAKIAPLGAGVIDVKVEEILN